VNSIPKVTSGGLLSVQQPNYQDLNHWTSHPRYDYTGAKIGDAGLRTFVSNASSPAIYCSAASLLNTSG
jgi:hypothetical protein